MHDQVSSVVYVCMRVCVCACVCLHALAAQTVVTKFLFIIHALNVIIVNTNLELLSFLTYKFITLKVMCNLKSMKININSS